MESIDEKGYLNEVDASRGRCICEVEVDPSIGLYWSSAAQLVLIYGLSSGRLSGKLRTKRKVYCEGEEQTTRFYPSRFSSLMDPSGWSRPSRLFRPLKSAIRWNPPVWPAPSFRETYDRLSSTTPCTVPGSHQSHQSRRHQLVVCYHHSCLVVSCLVCEVKRLLSTPLVLP